MLFMNTHLMYTQYHRLLQEYARGAHTSTTRLPSPDAPGPPPMHTLRPLRRSSSRIQRWVQDQQKRLSGDSTDAPDTPDATVAPAASSGCHPWLAYPGMGKLAAGLPRDEEGAASDVASLAESFVVIDAELSNVLRNASVTQVSDSVTCPCRRELTVPHDLEARVAGDD